jgi:hypothetical protein
MDRKTIDDKAVKAAHDIKHKELELIETLQWVEQFRIYEDFELTSLFAYCTQRLGISEDRACTYIKVARKALEVPALKQAIANDRLSLSNAKKLTTVLTPENQTDWLEKGTTLSTRNLEKEIAKEKPETKVNEKVKPISKSLFELRCILSPKAVELLERTMDLLNTQNRGEVLENVLEEFVQRHDPIKVAERAEKRKAHAPAPVPAARPAYKNGKRTATPKAMANEALRKAGGACTHLDSRGVRCTNRRYLQKHHPHFVSRGGVHCAQNLSVLCRFHHHAMHHRATP